MHAHSLPTREEEQELHRRLSAGDKTAISDLAAHYYEAIIDHLRRTNKKYVSDDEITNAAFETWDSISKNPRQCDPAKSLWSFLKLAAQRDLMNILAKQKRRRKHEVAFEHVEQFPDRGIVSLDAEREAEIERIRRDLLPIIRAGLSDPELRCLELHLEGERKTGAYAVVLGIADQSEDEQEAIVKRIKDKLKTRIKRARAREES